jgi:hypothetical protein
MQGLPRHSQVRRVRWPYIRGRTKPIAAQPMRCLPRDWLLPSLFAAKPCWDVTIVRYALTVWARFAVGPLAPQWTQRPV